MKMLLKSEYVFQLVLLLKFSWILTCVAYVLKVAYKRSCVYSPRLRYDPLAISGLCWWHCCYSGTTPTVSRAPWTLLGPFSQNRHPWYQSTTSAHKIADIEYRYRQLPRFRTQANGAAGNFGRWVEHICKGRCRLWGASTQHTLDSHPQGCLGTWNQNILIIFEFYENASVLDKFLLDFLVFL